MRIISFLSQKGGVGKSTACVNLATALAERHYRVLLVDLDTNACASRLFGVVAAMENSVVAALIGEQPLASLIQPTGLEGIWLVPGSTILGAIHDLPVAQLERRGEDGHLSDEALAVELENLGRDHFDFIFVDCPGGQVLMEQLSLLACDEVVVPTGLSVFDLFAATPTLQLIAMAQSIRGGQPDFLGFLPTGTTSAGVPRRMQVELNAYQMPCFTPIRHSALMRTIANAPDVRQRVVLNARPDSAIKPSWQPRCLSSPMNASRPSPDCARQTLRHSVLKVAGLIALVSGDTAPEQAVEMAGSITKAPGVREIVQIADACAHLRTIIRAGKMRPDVWPLVSGLDQIANRLMTEDSPGVQKKGKR